MDPWSIADRYGFTVLGYALLAWFVIRVLWPFMVEQNRLMQEQHKSTHQMLSDQVDAGVKRINEQAEVAYRRSQEQTKEFLGSLEKQGAMFEKVTSQFVEQLKTIEHNTRRN